MLQVLLNGLMVRYAQSPAASSAPRLVDAYTLISAQLPGLEKASRQLSSRKEDAWAEMFLERLDRLAVKLGQPPPSAELRAAALESKPGIPGRQLAHTVAGAGGPKSSFGVSKSVARSGDSRNNGGVSA